jgi:hypothetical protein
MRSAWRLLPIPGGLERVLQQCFDLQPFNFRTIKGMKPNGNFSPAFDEMQNQRVYPAVCFLTALETITRRNASIPIGTEASL